MCAKGLLQKLINKSCDFMHKHRKNTLIDIVSVLLSERRLTMTELGNGLSTKGQTTEKHSIKRVCRFLSNKHIYEESFDIQKNLAAEMLSDFRQVRINIDWTPSNTDQHYILRATVIHQDSNFTLYQKIYSASEQNSPKVESVFLDNLKLIIPDHITGVTIITDAGFYYRWIKKVASLGWQFIGRIRGTTLVSLDNGLTWVKATSIANSEPASNKSRYLGEILFTKKHQYVVKASVYKQKLKPLTKASNRNKKRRSHNTSKALSSWEAGWFLVTNSIQLTDKNKEYATTNYKMRMKIEASNRCTKSSKYGFGFEQSMSKQRKRLAVLILLEQIAQLVAWAVGCYTEKTNTPYKFFNGSAKNGRRLSLVNLGLKALKHNIKIPISDDFFSFIREKDFCHVS